MSRLNRYNVLRSKVLLGLIALATLLALIGLPTESVDAHANQINSVPAPNSELETSPDRIIVWYSEPIEETFSVVTVLNSVAERVDLDDSARDSSEPSAMSVGLPPLENGTYTVVWKNLSAVDGHKVIGSFVFAVGEPLSAGAQIAAAEQPLLQTVADPWLRWLVFLTAAIVIGGLTFELIIGIPVVYGEAAKNSWQAAGVAVSAAWSKIAFASLFVLILAMLGQLLQQASVLSGNSAFEPDFEVLRSVAFESGWGRLWTYRLIAAIGIGVLFILAIRSAAPIEVYEPDDEDDEPELESALTADSIVAQIAAVLGLVFLGLIATSSHNAAAPSEIKMLATATDFIHLVASMAWLGGVIYLAIAVPVFIRELGSSRAGALFEAAISRFTVLGLLSAGVLVITGIFSSYMQVTVPDAVATPYGWFLVGKLALIVPLFGFAAYNGFKLAKRLGVGGEKSLGRSLVIESVIAVLVFAAVGWLASLEPARQYAGRTGIGAEDKAAYQDVADGTEFDIKIDPAEVGKNDVIVRITKPNGEAIDNAVDVRVRLKFVDDDLGEPLVSLEDTGAGIWRLSDAQLNIAGEYQAEVVVQRPDAFDSRTAFRFDARSTATAADSIKPDIDTANLLFGIQLLLIGGLVVVLGVRGKIVPSIFKNSGAQTGLMAPGVVIAVLGLLFVLNVQVLRIGLAEDIRNPFPPTAESVAIGGPAYATACVACHGAGGLGDGPAGAGLPKTPADLLIHVPLHSDTILFEFIDHGIPQAGMPGQAGVLTEDEMWHLVNYLRAEFDSR
ncbi:MAG: c-type cytochrome [Chloroflexi bacterium]|nr:c-type cytochrome [Chloroflexota bacterium]MBT5627762.1 c-type cytochrome [Chloroflexota bacterium]